jgi:SulP family sulfate permease
LKKLIKFDFTNIKGDLFGGLTAGIVALPLALAFGVQSGMGASAGMYGAFIIGILAAFFGGTPTQISGPTAPMTVISTLLVATIVAANDGDFATATPIILTVFLLAGLMEVLFGILGIGNYIKYIPYPVVSGFMSGIGVIILITQIFPLLGYSPAKDEVLIEKFKPAAEEVLIKKILKSEVKEGILVLENYEETIKRGKLVTQDDITKEARLLAKSDASGVLGSLKYLPRAIKNINWKEFWLAILSIFIIYGFKRITTKIPSALIALVVVTAIVMGMGWADVRTIRSIEEIPAGFPPFQSAIFTNFSLPNILPYLGVIFTLALLGAIDSLLTSVVADNLTKTKHDSNQELIGQGIGNSVAALFGGIPGAGATIRTVVNINAGGKTRISGIVAGVLLLLILLVLGPIASSIPLPVLAGILITVGIGVMDYKGLKAIPKMPKGDVFVMLLVLFLTVFLDLIQAVGIGVVISALIFMKKMGDVTNDQSKVVNLNESENAEEEWLDEKDFPKQLREEVFIKHLNGPLFFGYTSDFQKIMTQIPTTAKYVIIRMGRVPYVDQSGLFALEDTLIDLVKKDIKILFVGIQEQPLYRLKSIGIIPDLVPESQVFDKFKNCVQWVKANVVDEYATPKT